MSNTNFDELLNAGCHFGHLTRKWNPKMAPYIFMERNDIHIIDLNKTAIMLDKASAALKQIAKSGRKILFVATKKQAKDIVAEKISNINMPYVTERWPGGMLTNFPTIRKAVKKMTTIDKMEKDGTFDHLSKREKLQISRQRAKLDKNLGSIADLTRLPAALFVVDVMKEYIAVKEAKSLGIPVFAQAKGGIATIFGLTGGFLLGFIPFTYLCSKAMECKNILAKITLSVIGLLSCHLFGVLQYSILTGVGFTKAALLVSIPFLAKDLASVAFAFATVNGFNLIKNKINN